MIELLSLLNCCSNPQAASDLIDRTIVPPAKVVASFGEQKSWMDTMSVRTKSGGKIDPECSRREFEMGEPLPEPGPDPVRCSTRHNERDEHEKVFDAKLDLNRGRFLGMSIVQRPKDNLLEVKAVQNAGAVTLWNSEHYDTQITEGCRLLWVDGAAGDVRAMLTQINRTNKQFISIKFQMPAATKHEERDEDTVFKAKLDLNRGRFLGMSIIPRHKDKLLEVKDLQERGAVALWNWEHDETQLTEGCRVLWVDGVAGDVSAMVTQINKPKQFICVKFQRPATTMDR